MNSAKQEKRQMEESISQKYEEIFRLLEQTNELSRESGISEEDLISPSIIPPNKIAPLALPYGVFSSSKRFFEL
ncbi:unnamed protein product [Onchocerca flexuosa]|uniref:Uncharacterized protein n=1 Tax=Onchocerca flexuosa TaxID=387005 RepID=A0A183I8L1_9BILA|nr:unnamed protein product [Onchocerca flexuosa]